MIYADPPRKYSPRGKRWSHLSSPSIAELEDYAAAYGLKRKDRHPWIHYDVTESELKKLPSVTRVSHRELHRIMRPYRQPKK